MTEAGIEGTARAYLAHAEECVRLANSTSHGMIRDELLRLRQVYLQMADQLGKSEAIKKRPVSAAALIKRRNRRGEVMSKVKVYKFRLWVQAAGRKQVAPHMATQEFIIKARGEIIEGTGREVEGSFVDDNGQADIAIQPVA